MKPRSDALFGGKAATGSLKRTAVRSWAVTATGQGGKFLLNLVGTAIIARILTPADYGLVAMVTAFLSFISLFKDLGLSQATVQRAEITSEQVTGLFWFNVMMGLAVMLVTAGAAPFISHFYGHPELTWICVAYAAMAPVSSLGAQHSALLRRSMHYKSIVLRDLVASTLGTGAGIAAAKLGCGYWSLVIMQGVSEVMGTATLWWQSGWRPGPPRWTPNLLPLIKFGGAITVSNILGFIMSGLDSVLLGYFTGPVSLGIYNRAQNTLSRPLRQILPPIMNVAASAFARAANDPARFEKATLQLAFIISAASSLIVGIAAAGADWIVAIMLGPNWQDAVPITQVLALSAFVEPIGSMMATLMNARGLPGRVVRWRIWSATIIVGGIVIGLPWGPLGVATSYSLSGFFIRTPIFVWYASRHIGLNVPRVFEAIGGPLIAGAITLATLIIIRAHLLPHAHPAIGLMACAVVGAVVFLTVLALLRSSRERLLASLRLGRDSFRPTTVRKQAGS